MSGTPFVLQPFDAAAAPAGLRIEGRIRRQDGTLTIDYRVSGPLGDLRLPAPAAAPARRDGLWQRTCLEGFLAVPGREPYWEINLSPSGDWNVYRLDGYRRNLRPEPAVAALPSHRHDGPDGLEMGLSLPLEGLISPGEALEAGLTAVIEGGDGSLSYWALTHPGPEPDFHRREGFRMPLSAG